MVGNTTDRLHKYVELEINMLSIDEVAIIPKSAESAKTVPMAMLRDAWNNGEICTNEYQNKKLLEIAARYGYAVTESGKEEGR